jgi:predicted phage-related endonuclease
MLSPEQLAQRDGKITASFAPKLMAGDEKEIYRKWQELVGDPAWQPENLDDVWVVQFGSYVEPFALDWHQKKIGRPLTRRGEVVCHPERPWLCCTLDAYDEREHTAIDCKTILDWPGRNIEEQVRYYTPQLVVQRACTVAGFASLLIVLAGKEPVEYDVSITAEYEAQVLSRCDWLWRCVETLTPPFKLDPIVAPIVPAKDYNMHGNNEWASNGQEWLDTLDAHQRNVAAEKAIKKLVPEDARKCFGHGIQITRNKAGSMSLREAK